ncbi:DUF1176 domain-containing protein [Lysobacter auxotrophicus]|uniref:DUF1176 domain-containing protein n=1 Tax=Lysobacter auxotrophicus TaxID=2992573 RepID=A0ABM8D8P5_9GAMM|nr:DUF1176 domain-containing protein [Lysobacter auxotrophicus]BDU14917.1 hypothetical protein LA521A_01180 [Lysobacter auxotrophicus]
MSRIRRSYTRCLGREGHGHKATARRGRCVQAAAGRTHRTADRCRTGAALAAYTRRQGDKLLAQAATGAGTDDCDPPDPESVGDQVFALDATRALVALRCLGGAYQSSFLMLSVDRAMQSAPALVEFPGPPGIDGEAGAATALLVDPIFASGTLTSLAKGRDLGDCGELSQWRYDGQRFRLGWSARLDRCGGVLPDDWPVIWRTSNADTKALEGA